MPKPNHQKATQSSRGGATGRTRQTATTVCSKEKFLAIVVQYSDLNGGKGAPKDYVAKRAGYGSATTPAFHMAVKRQSDNGYLVVDRAANLLRATPSGEELAKTVTDLPQNNEEQLRIIHESLAGMQQKLFEELMDGTPKSREILALKLGYKKSSDTAFVMLLSRVKKRGFLEYDKSTVELTDVCFVHRVPEDNA